MASPGLPYRAVYIIEPAGAEDIERFGVIVSTIALRTCAGIVSALAFITVAPYTTA